MHSPLVTLINAITLRRWLCLRNAPPLYNRVYTYLRIIIQVTRLCLSCTMWIYLRVCHDWEKREIHDDPRFSWHHGNSRLTISNRLKGTVNSWPGLHLFQKICPVQAFNSKQEPSIMISAILLINLIYSINSMKILAKVFQLMQINIDQLIQYFNFQLQRNISAK